MEDRRFTEVDLRTMLDKTTGIRTDIVAGRWVAVSKLRRKSWEIILEPDHDVRLIVVITAYPIGTPA